MAARKLGNILQELIPLADQGKVKGFFTNVNNAEVLNGLVENIRDAVMDYQVCIQSKLNTLMSDISFRLPYSKISMNRAVSLL